MPDQNKILIMKFGGKALQDIDCFGKICQIIIQKKKRYPKIVVVISAMEKLTDTLKQMACAVNQAGSKREMDMLLTAGERISMALLAMALEKRGVRAMSFTGSQAGIITSMYHGEARVIDVRFSRLKQAFEHQAIPIVAGFQGVSLEKEVTTLGRGGSDTTAVVLGIALGAKKVEFYKDVDGIYSSWPSSCLSEKCSYLTYSQALRIIEGTGGRILHPRAVHLAQKNQLPLEVLSFKTPNQVGTVIQEKKQTFLKTTYESI